MKRWINAHKFLLFLRRYSDKGFKCLEAMNNLMWMRTSIPCLLPPYKLCWCYLSFKRDVRAMTSINLRIHHVANTNQPLLFKIFIYCSLATQLTAYLQRKSSLLSIGTGIIKWDIQSCDEKQRTLAKITRYPNDQR